MKVYNLLLIGLMAVTFGCEKKDTEVKVPTPSPSNPTSGSGSGSESEDIEVIFTSLNSPKSGFECEMQVEGSTEVSKIFYRDTSEDYPEKILTQNIYTVLDDSSVDTGIVIGDRKLLWILNYDSVANEIYRSTTLTSSITEVEPTEYLMINAHIEFDKISNEFLIDIIGSKAENQVVTKENLQSARINNCIPIEMKVPFGL